MKVCMQVAYTAEIGLWMWQSQKRLWPLQNNFVNIIFLQSQNLFWNTNEAFWLYLTKYFMSNPTLTTKSG